MWQYNIDLKKRSFNLEYILESNTIYDSFIAYKMQHQL